MSVLYEVFRFFVVFNLIIGAAASGGALLGAWLHLRDYKRTLTDSERNSLRAIAYLFVVLSSATLLHFIK